MNHKNLHDRVLERFRQYQQLEIGGKKVQCTYFINHIQTYFRQLMLDAGIEEKQAVDALNLYKERKVPFGWYRGKGQPEEIAEATVAMANHFDFSLEKSTPSGIRELMTMCGIGIDCSGLVFEILRSGFAEIDKEDLFMDALAWSDPEKKRRSYAGSKVFAGKFSTQIEPKDLEALDLILKRGKENYVHIGIIFKINGKLYIGHSAPGTTPSGVRLEPFGIEDDTPKFGFSVDLGSDWSEFYSEGSLEFRRMNILSSL